MHCYHGKSVDNLSSPSLSKCITTQKYENIFITTIVYLLLLACKSEALHLTISARPVFLAEAVPGSEEDQPCISCSPIYMSIPGLYAVRDGGTTN